MSSTNANLAFRPALSLLAAYVAREASPVEVLRAVADQIAATQPIVNAFTALCLDEAQTAAAAAERAYRSGAALRPLEGIPVAVKDFFDTVGMRTAVGSSIFRDRVPATDAEAVRRVREAGGIVIGKTATHEFGWGITTDSASFGPTHNPWAPELVAGGSSGGSAVALATGQTVLAIGSDTGGSIRIPAAFCGVVGMKPTWGRVSCSGAFPLAPSLDHPGAMARTPGDAGLLLDVLAGVSPRARRPASSLDGIRVGLCSDLHLVALPDAQQDAFAAAEKTVRSLGAEMREVRLPDADRIVPTFATIQQAEALHVHRRAGLWPARAAEYGEDVRGRLRGAETVGLADYLDALEERRQIAWRFATVFAEVDVILTPVAAAGPVPIGETTARAVDGAQVPLRDLVMPYTVPQDLAGLPACAVRAGFDESGLPVAVQFTGAVGADDLVLDVAAALHAATADIQDHWPPTQEDL
jgi:aspartyl-tRNA(Asn)/glutamyl-tRNA(Gln) amidotransferase subunit A